MAECNQLTSLPFKGLNFVTQRMKTLQNVATVVTATSATVHDIEYVLQPVKISSPNDLYCVEWDVKPYSTQLQPEALRTS